MAVGQNLGECSKIKSKKVVDKYAIICYTVYTVRNNPRVRKIKE